MKKYSPTNWKESLLKSIDKLQENKKAHFEKPDTAFSRNQKISLWDTILFPMVAGSETTSIELLDYFKMDNLPSQPAMSYRRDQVKYDAYKAVFQDFTGKVPQNKTFRGLHLVACDGSRLNTPYNPKDTDSFVNRIEGRKGFNQYHLVTCYDLLNEVFTDAVIQGYYSMNEKLALCTMLDDYSKDKKTLFIADRGFSSYSVIAHAINNGHLFLIRLIEPMARNIFHDTQCIDNDNVIDVEDTFYIGRVKNKNSKQLKNYHYMNTSKTYDCIPVGSKNIDCFHVRLVKLQLPDGNPEYLLTNLPKETFSLADLEELYRMRWGIETSFRYLKYTSGLVHMHSIKPKFIFQEIYAKLTLHNFCMAVKQCTNIKNSEELKHKYVIEQTYLIKCCIRFIKGILDDIINLVEKRKVPVRAGRTFDRKLRRQHADTLQYR